MYIYIYIYIYTCEYLYHHQERCMFVRGLNVRANVFGFVCQYVDRGSNPRLVLCIKKCKSIDI